eukprot:3937424-Amphidinium_carterae.3
MKKALMTNGAGGFQCKVCNARSQDLRGLIDHYTSRHFDNDAHVAMQKRVLNISTHISPRELGMALEIFKKHGKRLNPRWDYEAYREDVMASRGGQFVDKHQVQATPSPRKGNPVESMRDERNEPAQSVMTRWDIANPDRGKSVSGRSAKGRPEELSTEVCIEDHRIEPARTVMTRWDTPNPDHGRSVSGRSDLDRLGVDRVERYANRVERYADGTPSTRCARKRPQSDSSYSERDDAKIDSRFAESTCKRETPQSRA